jgi:hypothetical protein
MGLNEYKKIIYSQWGEDGIIKEIFRRIGPSNRFCVEFGAGNGSECSNTWHLIKDEGWRSLLIEGNYERYQKWLILIEDMPRVKIINVFVEIKGKRCIEEILRRNGVPYGLDLLSIDVDGNEHHLFKSLKIYKPRVLIIEHNPTIPVGDAIVQEPDETAPFGASAQANVNLAHEKGYALVAVTGANCIFVLTEELDRLGIQEPNLYDVFDPLALSYVISSYTGALYLMTKNIDRNPTYGWLYDAHNLFIKKTLHAFTFGFSLNSRLSKILSKVYQPIKILRMRNQK